VPTKTRFINPETLTKPPAYTQVVEVTTPGRMVFISGQIGVGRDGKLVPGDFRAQALQTFENLKAALEAVDVRGLYLNMAAPPASTSVRVVGFAREGVLLEVEAIAVLPD
jgi:enamine deaminase RidA (YjgF/YER057c/UK114 family)